MQWKDNQSCWLFFQKGSHTEANVTKTTLPKVCECTAIALMVTIREMFFSRPRRRRGYGGLSPLDFEISYFPVLVEKYFSLSFGVYKTKFHHCWPPRKNIVLANPWKNPLLVHPGKNPSNARAHDIDILRFQCFMFYRYFVETTKLVGFHCRLANASLWCLIVSKRNLCSEGAMKLFLWKFKSPAIKPILL